MGWVSKRVGQKLWGTDEQRRAAGKPPDLNTFKAMAEAGNAVNTYGMRWVYIEDGRVGNPRRGKSVPLAGARATVDTVGEIRRSFSEARPATVGILGATKKRDEREVTLVIEGSDNGLILPVAPHRRKAVMAFAKRVNTLAKQAEAAAEPPHPSAPAHPPTPGLARSETGAIPDQIRRVAQLRDQGFVTDQEFEAKKAELLDRL